MVELEARLEALGDKARKHSEVLETEEAAKFALVNPLIQALGYDLSNPSEVVPEFTCDFGGKKGEKVDYALKVGGNVAILIECKSSRAELSLKHASQLCRYFSASDAKFAILTNGVIYKFYSDLDSANRMDNSPFLEVDILNLKKDDVRGLSRFQKSEFDLEAAAEAAASMQMEGEVANVLKRELAEPSDEMVRLIASKVTDRRLTAGVKSAIARHIPNAFNTIIRNRLDAKWSSAMKEDIDPELASTSEIETTEDEIEGFNIIRSIGSEVVDPARIVIRDSQSYCAVLLDDNNRKPIARMRFNSPTTKYLGTFDAEKNEELKPVERPVDIYKYKAEILTRISAMLD
ncbi:type I restriction endonuclease [Alteriqipengyuania sp.]|uniref:type I restriction endonuclease n=1 Tax=Alteriqipengyuania sp. TaxID=2800692 RepID=UPI00351553A0